MEEVTDWTPFIVLIAVGGDLVLVSVWLLFRRPNERAKADALWTIGPE